MIETIKRYGNVQYEGWCEIPNGDFVKYDDHIKALALKDEEIRELREAMSKAVELTSVGMLTTATDLLDKLNSIRAITSTYLINPPSLTDLEAYCEKRMMERLYVCGYLATKTDKTLIKDSDNNPVFLGHEFDVFTLPVYTIKPLKVSE